MFSGIIETLGEVTKIEKEETNTHFTIESQLSAEAYIDQSISHNGVCLTVVAHDDKSHVVTAIDETLSRTNFGQLSVGDKVNLERALKVGARLDGHFVQGHVDTVATCTKIDSVEGSWMFHFKTNPDYELNMVEKGSICINGISLTLVDASTDNFSVAIIPYTYEHTNLRWLKPFDEVNIEFDILGKYILKTLKHQFNKANH
ncbi:MAG: riboflavin synthase [Saprospiraceae bacterium]|nr:MAG: riboflavin synthase subunit alpha [Bacteroidetes bacterium OLB9]MCO6463180.1 riboflavin synthase [Saprospiraceae bacterium]MCZ2338735.1 riboflavin synthase [Chitinophagales bacterium]